MGTIANPQARLPLIERKSRTISPYRWPMHIAAMLRFWHVASLDAPTVAVVWSCALAWVVHICLAIWAPLLLGLVTWSLYISDRLLDARAGLRTPPQHHLRDRHTFHWRHRRILLPLALTAAAASAGIVLARIPPSALRPDSLVAAATLAYFSGVHSRRKLPALLNQLTHLLVSRAFLVGTLFTAGCTLPLWSQSTENSAELQRLIVPALCLSTVAWLNVRAIGLWESRSPHPVRSTILPAAAFIALSALAAAAFFLVAQPRIAALLAVAACSALLLALLDAQRHRLSAIALRSLADLVLLTPALLLPAAFSNR